MSAVAVPTPAAPLFGRQDLMERAGRLLQAARDGSGGAMVFSGVAGIGKSSVLRAVTDVARGLGFVTLLGRALPEELPEPFSLIRDLIRTPRQRSAESGAGGLRGGALPLFLAPAGPVAEELLEAPREAEPAEKVEAANWLLSRLGSPVEWVDASRSQLFARLTEYFTGVAGNRPLLLAIDDLQFGDASSLEFLGQFARDLQNLPIVVVATVTPPPEIPERNAAAVEAFFRTSDATRVSLRPFSEAELADYVRWILNGRDPGRDALMRWFSQTEGNPLFVEHLVKATMGFGGSTLPAEPSHDLAHILEERVKKLGEPERRVLAYATVLGKEFDFSTLTEAAHREEERLTEALDRLVQAGILREKGGEVYEFVRESLRANVYTSLTETRRRILHLKVAEALERRPSASDFELARHFYLARLDAKALEYNRRAADLSAQAFAFDSAVVHVERALEAAQRLPTPDRPTIVRLQIELGRFLDELGNLRRSQEVLDDAVTRARGLQGNEDALAFALLGLAQTRSDLGEYRSAQALGEEAFAIIERRGRDRELMAAHRILGIVSWRLGELDIAAKHQREEVALAERAGSTNEKGHALVDLANTYIQRGEAGVSEALQLYERAAELFEASEDFSARARVLMNRALLHHNVGQIPEALSEISEALEAAERSRSPIWIGYCSLNLAQFQAESRNFPLAHEAIERADSLLTPLGDRLGAQQIRMIRGMIAQGEENFVEARRFYLEATELAAELGLASEGAEMLFRRSSLALAEGNVAEARRLLTESKTAGLLRLRGDLSGEIRELETALENAPPAQH